MIAQCVFPIQNKIAIAAMIIAGNTRTCGRLYLVIGILIATMLTSNLLIIKEYGGDKTVWNLQMRKLLLL